jgi:hypothetical protein
VLVDFALDVPTPAPSCSNMRVLRALRSTVARSRWRSAVQGSIMTTTHPRLPLLLGLAVAIVGTAFLPAPCGAPADPPRFKAIREIPVVVVDPAARLDGVPQLDDLGMRDAAEGLSAIRSDLDRIHSRLDSLDARLDDVTARLEALVDQNRDAAARLERLEADVRALIDAGVSRDFAAHPLCLPEHGDFAAADLMATASHERSHLPEIDIADARIFDDHPLCLPEHGNFAVATHPTTP